MNNNLSPVFDYWQFAHYVLCAHCFLLLHSSTELYLRINYLIMLMFVSICSKWVFGLVFLFICLSSQRIPVQRCTRTTSCSTRPTPRWSTWSRRMSSSRSSSASRPRGQRRAGRSTCDRRPCDWRGRRWWCRGSSGWRRSTIGSSSSTKRPTGGSSCWKRSTKGQVSNQLEDNYPNDTKCWSLQFHLSSL